jgi:hypothetical protein
MHQHGHRSHMRNAGISAAFDLGGVLTHTLLRSANIANDTFNTYTTHSACKPHTWLLTMLFTYHLCTYRYGRDAVVQRLTPICPVDLAKSSKLQDAEWLGKVANAARDGDAAAMKTLLQHERAKQRMKKLRKPMEVRLGSRLLGVRVCVAVVFQWNHLTPGVWRRTVKANNDACVILGVSQRVSLAVCVPWVIKHVATIAAALSVPPAKRGVRTC